MYLNLVQHCPNNGVKMQVVKTFKINNKEAKLILLNDNSIQIIYDDTPISTSSQIAWNHIKDEEWAQYGLVKIEVESYMAKKESLENLNRIAKEAFK